MSYFHDSTRLVIGWRAIDSKRTGLSTPAAKAKGARAAADEAKKRAKREADAETWIKGLRIGKALRDACNRRSKK